MKNLIIVLMLINIAYSLYQYATYSFNDDNFDFQISLSEDSFPMRKNLSAADSSEQSGHLIKQRTRKAMFHELKKEWLAKMLLEIATLLVVIWKFRNPPP